MAGTRSSVTMVPHLCLAEILSMAGFALVASLLPALHATLVAVRDRRWLAWRHLFSATFWRCAGTGQPD